LLLLLVNIAIYMYICALVGCNKNSEKDYLIFLMFYNRSNHHIQPKLRATLNNI